MKVKINGKTYNLVEDVFSGIKINNRDTLYIHLKITYDEIKDIAKDNMTWATFDGETEVDKSEYSYCERLIVHKDTTTTIVMSKPNNEDDLLEIIESLIGG